MKGRVLTLFLLLLVPGVASAYTNPGTPTGFVSDFAGMIPANEKAVIERTLQEFEKTTSNEIAVVTIPSLEGDTIENVAVSLFADWKIGKDKKDNGVLLLIARDDREMRIEVGYGLEGALTDAQSYWIIRDVLTPRFKEGNYALGISEAIDKIMAATKGEYVPSASRTSLNTPSLFRLLSDYGFFLLFPFFWFASILGRSKSWWLGGVLGGVVGVIIGFFFGFLFIGIISIVGLSVLGLFFDFIVSRSYNKYASGGGVPPWWLGGGGHGGSGFGGGGGFGGFGGGGSGGGGSSGRW